MSTLNKITFLTAESSWFNEYMPGYIDRLSQTIDDVHWVHHQAQVEASDCLFILSYFEAVATSVLNLNQHNLVVHESDLPKGKGWSPLTWQILEGKNDIPITLFEATEAIDAGPIYSQKMLHLRGDELLPEIKARQAELTLQLCDEFIMGDHEAIIRQARAQEGQPSFYPRRQPEDSQLDIHDSLSNQFNLLRVVDNERYPAFFEINGKRYILKIYPA